MKQREREAREKEARKREKAEEKEKRRKEYNAQMAAVAAREQQKKKNEEKKKKNGQAAGGIKASLLVQCASAVTTPQLPDSQLQLTSEYYILQYSYNYSSSTPQLYFLWYTFYF